MTALQIRLRSDCVFWSKLKSFLKVSVNLCEWCDNLLSSSKIAGGKQRQKVSQNRHLRTRAHSLPVPSISFAGLFCLFGLFFLLFLLEGLHEFAEAKNARLSQEFSEHRDGREGGPF